MTGYADDELVTIAEAARRLGLARVTVQSWLSAGYVGIASSEFQGRRERLLLRWSDVVACAAEREANRQRYSTKP